MTLRGLRFALFLFVAGALAPGAFADCSQGTRTNSTNNGAPYSIWVPPSGCWNGNVVVFAHGYVAPAEPLGVPDSQLTIGGVSLPATFNQLGFIFAASGYSKNGLAIVQGVNDSRDLVNNVIKPAYAPRRVYLIGASEGGLVTTLSAEQLPNVYSIGGAACGPIGSFQGQINYFGDARVLFDYFFPGVLPPSPISIPQPLIDNWDSIYAKAVAQAISNNPQAAQQWLKVLQGTITTDLPTMIQTGLGVLWYNVFATNDATATLGGQPYDNHNRIYLGSNNDLLLNFKVQRFNQSPIARAAIAAQYETSGRLRMPLVTLHTTGDPIVPYWHETLYTLKTLQAGTFFQRSDIPVVRYGHCAFTGGEVLAAFALMVLRDIGSNLTPSIRSTLTGPDLLDFERAGRLNGLIRE